MRVHATDAEQKLWRRLRAKQLGVTFRRQYSVDAYILDFYAPRLKLAVEVDGGAHFEPFGMEHDKVRTAPLKSFGIQVLRFSNLEVLENSDGVIEVIRQSIATRITSP